VTQISVLCPNDHTRLTPMQGSEEFLFTCRTCNKTWMRRATGEIEEALPPGRGMTFVPRFVIDQLYARTDASAADLQSSSSGLVDRLERVETSLSSLLKETPGAADRQEIVRIRDDATTALENARGAQGASRKLQEDLRSLQKAIDDLGLTTLRARIEELERLYDRHVRDHP
jgi:hypothetical protein